MGRLLTEQEIPDQLKHHDHWELSEPALTACFTLDSTAEARSLVVRAMDEAKHMNHHPEVQTRGNGVSFVLSTHSAGGITELDIEPAIRIDRLLT